MTPLCNVCFGGSRIRIGRCDECGAAYPRLGEQPQPKTALLLLADRCEREEPSDDLSEDIARALGYVKLEDYSCRWIAPDKSTTLCGFGPPNYTQSLDAAVTLVPEGLGWTCGDHSPGGVHVGNYLASVWKFDRATGLNMRFAKTPALALCAAALRARAALSPPTSPDEGERT